jgi:hypothetical protein
VLDRGDPLEQAASHNAQIRTREPRTYFMNFS